MTSHEKKWRQQLEMWELDGLLLVSRENKFYTAGLYSGSGYVLITRKGCYVIVDSRYYFQQKEQKGKAQILLADDKNSFYNHINAISDQDQIRRLGFEEDAVTFRQYENLKYSLKPGLIPVSPDVIRMIKDENEITCIMKACEIADEGYSYILGQIRSGMTEKQVENHLLSYMKEMGGQKEAFDIIIASGVNGAMPHAKAGGKVIESGDFVVMDFGVRFGEYCSDITRTVAVEYINPLMGRIYDIVRRAQDAAIGVIRPGRTCREIDRAARAVIECEGFGKEFSHNLGHGLGIACHELPNFSKSDSTVLKPGMVMTVEPGIYVEGLGGVRIEDDILVTDEGCRLLTKSPRELKVVG